jgi:hypothetical protein
MGHAGLNSVQCCVRSEPPADEFAFTSRVYAKTDLNPVCLLKTPNACDSRGLEKLEGFSVGRPAE